MAKALQEWIADDVRRARRQSLRALSEQFFFRDPIRPTYSDVSYFFAPADGVIMYQRQVAPDAPLVEIKGIPYTLRDALRQHAPEQACLAIGIFMTLYDVHVNRVPFAGMLRHDALPPIETHNRPMLSVEEALLHGRVEALADADYLFSNQRMVSRVYTSMLGLTYFLLQIADYDVSAILPFSQERCQHYAQNQRFSEIRFGSQVDLIIPLSAHWRFETMLPDRTHVEAGLDPLVRITPVEAVT